MTTEQKQKCLDIATWLKEIFSVEHQVFLHQIVALDETWIRDFEPELKSQSYMWRATGFPWAKKNFDKFNRRLSK